MMQGTKKAHPTAATVEQVEAGAGLDRSTTSTTKHTTPPPPPQAAKISDFLSKGEQNAIPLRHLRELLHLPARTVRLMIRQERLHGAPILESSSAAGGYYLPSSTGEWDFCAKRLRHSAAQIIKVADAIAAEDCIEGADI